MWMFGHAIGLSSAQITPLGGRHFRATFTWLALGPSVAGGHEAAVSRLEGAESVRIVHLPTYALLPPAQWQPGQIVRETFDVELPGDIAPGRYTWRVGWYDLGRPDADATDARSRLPDSQEVVITTIELK
jgi:hypothetical protein